MVPPLRRAAPHAMGEDRAKIIGSRLFAGPFLRARSITAGLTRSNRPGTLRSVLIGLATPGSADMRFLLVFAAHRLFSHDAPIDPTITAQNGIAFAFTQPMAKKRSSTKRSSAKRDL